MHNIKHAQNCRKTPALNQQSLGKAKKSHLGRREKPTDQRRLGNAAISDLTLSPSDLHKQHQSAITIPLLCRLSVVRILHRAASYTKKETIVPTCYRVVFTGSPPFSMCLQ